MMPTILHGDCIEQMRTLPDNSVDAIVTDPPYDLVSGDKRSPRRASPSQSQREKIGGFMGMAWDGTGIAFRPETWAEALRVLKPGGHLLAFGGTRTYHRMACAVEDAGFEIRDQLQWLYGSGFPKSLDVSKAIDKAAGAQREVVGFHERDNYKRGRAGFRNLDDAKAWTDRGPVELTAPATPDAERWQGWGTALKPANEPIVLARKPLSEPTVAANVLRWGTGALNVDACRIQGESTERHTFKKLTSKGASGGAYGLQGHEYPVLDEKYPTGSPLGRWPANVILSHSLFCTDDACDPSCAVALLDAQSGERKAGRAIRHRSGGRTFGGDAPKPPLEDMGYGDTGGASRFYYVAKASRRERRGSKHPTVKPVALMRYLIRLVTPPGGIVLDPFAGSGTTGEACQLEGFGCVLIEREDEYVEDIRTRLGMAVEQVAD